MLKKTIWAIAAVLVLSPITGRAKTPDVWKCDFKGTWTEGGKSKGGFTWNVVWNGSNDKWAVTGTSTDDLGNTVTTGTCGDKNCTMEQKYTTGDLKDSTYYWAGTYVDADGKTDDTLIE